MEETQSRGWRLWQYKRIWVLVLIILSYYFAFVLGIRPLPPPITLAPETVTTIGSFPITNTLIASWLAMIILFIVAFGVRRAVNSGELVPSGVTGAIEAIVEILHNMTEATAGKWTRQIFPWFATIFFFVLAVNWMELLPGVESIGVLDTSHYHGEGHCELNELVGGITLVTGDPDCSENIIPFLRVASTDLNFTLALALLSVIFTQIYGVRALGISYFTKFFNFKTMFTVPMLGVIDFAVGLLELISEFAKILSFAFRLFGNIFAGSVLLLVIGSLVPVFVPSAILLLEFFIGAIQAIVFGMLTMVFMSQATQGHGDHAEEH
ncbi:MAG: F0F1 ATP synthase subunit A [Anaerolineales bacterium]|nr:F0F1 ATP synthase subunit A [Anaerolineales bacterium]